MRTHERDNDVCYWDSRRENALKGLESRSKRVKALARKELKAIAEREIKSHQFMIIEDDVVDQVL